MVTHNWGEYFPHIFNQTENFIIVKPPPTEEGSDTLMFLERMRALGYRFTVEGFSGLRFEKVG